MMLASFRNMAFGIVAFSCVFPVSSLASSEIARNISALKNVSFQKYRKILFHKKLGFWNPTRPNSHQQENWKWAWLIPYVESSLFPHFAQEHDKLPSSQQKDAANKTNNIFSNIWHDIILAQLPHRQENLRKRDSSRHRPSRDERNAVPRNEKEEAATEIQDDENLSNEPDSMNKPDEEINSTPAHSGNNQYI